MSNTIKRPFRLIHKEDIGKYTQKQHDIFIESYNKIYILERQVEELKLKSGDSKELISIQHDLDNLNNMMNTILDFIS